MKARGLQVQRGTAAARAGTRSGAHATHPVLALQRTAGNRAAVAALSSAVVQRKTGGTAKAQALARLKTAFGITDVREGTVGRPGGGDSPVCRGPALPKARRRSNWPTAGGRRGRRPTVGRLDRDGGRGGALRRRRSAACRRSRRSSSSRRTTTSAA